MKFILGYVPGTKSKITEGPVRLITLAAEHKGKRYELDRFHRTPSGLLTSKIRVYDAADFPEDMIKNLMEAKNILKVEGLT